MAGVALAWDGAATTRAVVVELYTSQGCSSCPPADELLHALASDDRVIPLALHVDYWDYLGWQDKFASARFTERQKAYARAAGDRMIYTPQMIVGGVERIVGSRADEVMAAVQAHAALPQPVQVALRREGDVLHVRAEAVPSQNRAMVIDLVRYMPEEEVSIERGENAGLTMTYTNIVTAWEHLAEWNGDAPIELSVPIEGSDRAVVLVQGAGPAEIVAASVLK